MSLYEKLQKATSEEDVKDAYIKALGLKEYQKNLVDIQTKEIWFEAKQNAKLSKEAKQVLAEGKKLWKSFFEHTDVRAVRDELKLNRPDVGWYQIRNALKKRNECGDFPPVSFKPFEEAYKTLTEKLQPMVCELGFLRV
jgi:hypothetical protein